MKLKYAFFAGVAAIAAPFCAHAEDPAVLVEFFTSQSCSSCVGATEYFGDLADRDGIVALAWHVDYWNALQTAHGRWVDPYSDATHTKRQRLYNQKLRGRGAVYTPQIVVNGAGEAVGSARNDVETLISQELKTSPSTSIRSINRRNDGGFVIDVAGEGEVAAVYFKPVAETVVGGGENAGRRFIDRNLVTDFSVLGAATGDASFSAPAPDAGETCAVLVQARDQGRVLAAQYCPQS